MTGLKIKLIYLLLYMGFAIWRVFYNIYLEGQHFTGSEIGAINALMQATLVFVVPVWGYLADKNGIRPAMKYALLFSAVLIFFLQYITDFPILVVYIFFLTLFYHPLGPLTDAMAVQFSVLQPRYNYGKLRLWGSLGWAIASMAGGLIFVYIDVEHIFKISALLFLSILPFIVFPIRRKVIYKPNFEAVDFKLLLRSKPLMGFVLILFLYGIACSPVNSFINLYFSELKAGNGIIGLAYGLQALSELPFFIIGAKLVKKIGPKRVILISIAVMVIRLFCYGLFPGITFSLLLGCLQGITLSFFLVGVVDYIQRLLPEGRHATAQSFIWGVYFGMGQTMGNLLIGVLKDKVGMTGVMTYAGGYVTIILMITFIYFKKIRGTPIQFS